MARTAGDWRCPTAGCVNHANYVFGRHQKCPLCGAAKEQSDEDLPLTEWDCPACEHRNPAGVLACEQCAAKAPDSARAPRMSRLGKSRGFNERLGSGEKRSWNSDDEDYDEFGRKKKGRREREGGSNLCEDAPISGKKSSKEMSAKQLAALERLRSKATARTLG
mmetsp:Transcript_13515/g.36468  ORF Transcript_13515/g.36468 Transcript_13515/m.36468 type:complete len:164 (+) Transcript_13515:126-617(+)